MTDIDALAAAHARLEAMFSVEAMQARLDAIPFAGPAAAAGGGLWDPPESSASGLADPDPIRPVRNVREPCECPCGCRWRGCHRHESQAFCWLCSEGTHHPRPGAVLPGEGFVLSAPAQVAP